jgi:hypothetical protein
MEFASLTVRHGCARWSAARGGGGEGFGGTARGWELEDVRARVLVW